MKEKQTIIIGNWKMNKNISDAKTFMEKFNNLCDKNKHLIPANLTFGFAVPATDIYETKAFSKHNKYIGAQNMYHEKFGAFTGEVSGSMIKSAGANSVIVGHSERRQIFHESDELINKKVKAALDEGLKPIFCVGETLTEHKSNLSKEVVKKQVLVGLGGVHDLDKVIIAYEPVWAIGTGETATAEYAQEMCQYIRGLLNGRHIRAIQYGGSVKPENIAKILSMPDIDGALVGGASLDPMSMMQLLTLNQIK